MAVKETEIIKPGYKTTEFYFSAMSQLIGILLASGLIGTGSALENIIGMAAMVLASLGYGVSRGMAKSAVK